MGIISSTQRRFSSSSSVNDRHHRTPVPYTATPPARQQQQRLDQKFSRIGDNYETLEQVTAALSRSGLESSNLIVGIDFTKSNEWTGAKSFKRKSLHTIANEPNPYEQAISIIGKTLSSFDDDNMIPCFGFGDASTHDKDVFGFYQDGRFCQGFEQVLSRYSELVPLLRLSGPTSFAPVIEMAMSIVDESGGQYHVLLIIADGQVTRSVDTPNNQLSIPECETVDAIVRASYYPLSIVVVGVGDGPWDVMKEFDDNLPQRAFDNFQFVNFTDIMSRNVQQSRKEAEFALSALMEIPTQYQATLELNIIGHKTGQAPSRTALPPPTARGNSSNRYSPYNLNSFQRDAPYYPVYRTTPTPSSSSSLNDNKFCPICCINLKDMAFGCGHQTCCDCGVDIEECTICQSTITTKIKLYS